MVEHIPNYFGRHLDQSGMVTNLAYYRAVKHVSAQFAQLLREGDFCCLAPCRVIAIPEFSLKPDRPIRSELQPFPPVLDRFSGQAVLRTPWAYIRQVTEYVAPCSATASECFAASVPSPKAHQFPERSLVRDRKIESARNPFVLSGIALLVRHVEIFVRRGIAFVLAEEFQAGDAAHRTVEVGDYTGDLENERAFGNNCGRVVAKLAERVGAAERLFQPFEFRAKPSGLAVRIG
ncbi:MAG: hypothetical protein OXQ29_07775 [Rhodospirillaceae bacterium]|nr:hypothetical protein [Rhodospirillaceae bacterium]